VPDALLTSSEVARLLGVTPGSVKRWADAGLLHCLRTAGRHRRFRADEVERFRGARSDRIAPSAAAWVARLLEEGEVQALQAQLLAERARLGSWWRVAESLGPVLAELGRCWEAGTLTVLEEHLASERLARALARCAESLPVRPGAPRLLLATAEEEKHTLGLSLVELAVREWGWPTLWAGRDTPLPEVVAHVVGGGVEAVAVSASALCDPERLRTQAEGLAAICRAGEVALAFGGSGAWPDELPHGRRMTGFEELRAWLADVERGLTKGGR
jgi:excisionase family DNA binding protein